MSKEPHDPLRAKYDNLRHKLAFKESVINEQREIILGASERLVQLEAENARLRKAEWYTWDQVSREIHDGDIWWHDNGDQIFPVNIMWCPTGNYFFASLGQWGWTRSQKLEEMGGVWTPCVEPERLKGGE